MIRLIAAALLALAVAAPAFACEWNQSAASGTQSTTTASQTGAGQGGRS